MNKIILSTALILFSITSYSQVLSFEDIKVIDSKDAFEKTMIENGFKNDSDISDENFAIYRYPEKTRWDISTFFVVPKKTFFFQFQNDEDYNSIFDDVKESCGFYEIMKSATGYSMSCYTCPGSKYPGKLCFGNLSIENIIPEN